ncbi:hypothetical protein ACFS7Z_24735 [Pontibacter toksunensis]|uniref:Uncharacterized protein n=1 Tax=Pontibacter toksunensis TaxID=1332631 RepID=A0ABW6C2F9_9BACT
MDQQQDQLATLHEIRSIMDRSSRFISLSGLSGVAAGVSALLGAGAVQWYLLARGTDYARSLGDGEAGRFLLAAAGLVFLVALCSATYFTACRARRANHRVWDSRSERLLANLLIPLGAGGVFCAALLYHGLPLLVAPAMLVFYGCALLNASKYTLGEIRYLGLLEVGLGLVACFWVGYGLLAWTLGFGVLHVVYGLVMYNKYER